MLRQSVHRSTIRNIRSLKCGRRFQSTENNHKIRSIINSTGNKTSDIYDNELGYKKLGYNNKSDNTNNYKMKRNNDYNSVIDEKLTELGSKPIDFNYYLYYLNDIKSDDQLPYKFGMNQMHKSIREGNLGMDETLNKILDRFDINNNPINYAFGYGSKIFSQGSSIDNSNSQIDMILSVDDPVQWHDKNIKLNNLDYSFLKFGGSKVVDYVGKLGAGIYFNPFVQINSNVELKYGITSTKSLMNDLLNWNTFYLAGRLHKPVAIVKNNPQLKFLNQFNLSNAIKLSILLLGKSETKESELYLQIAGLSYLGDPRLKVKGENPDKVKNIVENQFKLFQDLYKPILNNYHPSLIQPIGGAGDGEQTYKINLSFEEIGKILVELPKEFRLLLIEKFTKSNPNLKIDEDLIIQNMLTYEINTSIQQEGSPKYKDLKSIPLTSSSIDILNDIPSNKWEYLTSGFKFGNSQIIKEMSKNYLDSNKNFRSLLVETIEETVGSGALVQSVKGILTAGIGRSWKYAVAKRMKYEQSILKKNKGKK